MTYSSKELARQGVAPEAVGWRKWRSERGLTLRSMATMVGVDMATIRRSELGETKGKAGDKIAAFIARWERVPAVREALEAEVRRQKLRYRSAALARCKARGFKVNC